MADASETVPLTEQEQKSYTDAERGDGQAPQLSDLNFFGRLKEARKESDGPIDFVGKFFLILLSSGMITFYHELEAAYDTAAKSIWGNKRKLPLK